MALTPRNERIGQTENPPGSNIGERGPLPDIEGPKGAAETYGNDWQESGKAVFDGSAGQPGYSVADFDANIAITEGAGEV